MRAVIGKNTSQNIKVTNNGGILQTSTAVTLKNQVQELQSLEDIKDVDELDVVEGATLVYNSQNDKYEVRKLTSDDFSGAINLDGGEF